MPFAFESRVVQKPILFMGIFFATGAVAGLSLLFIWQFLFVNLAVNTIEHRAGGYEFINPLLECESAQEGSFQGLRPETNDIENIVNKYVAEGKVTQTSVYFRDLNNGPWFGINENDTFSPASLYKVPLGVAVLKKAETDGNFLEKQLLFSAPKIEETVQPNFKSMQKVQLGNSYSVQELLERMLIYSDNEAMYLLSVEVGEENILKVENDLGLKLTRGSDGESSISVKAYAGIFRVLYNASYLSKEMSDKLLRILSKSEFTAGLPAGVPNSVRVSHKFGERGLQDFSGKITLQLHDCGIVYKSQNPYLLCIMSKGVDFKEQLVFIDEISSTIYTNLDQK